tara:strand:- start:1107 stop:4325 length:3219 start_codon:yes stop_codon:yes gene_type:complete
MLCRHIIFFLVTHLTFNTLSQITPSDISDLKLWLSSDTLITLNNGKVVNWGDQSSSGFDLTNPNQDHLPVYLENEFLLGNNPCVSFVSNDYLFNSFLDIFDQPNTIIILFNSEAQGGYQSGFFDGTNAGNRNFAYYVNGRIRAGATGSNALNTYVIAQPFGYRINSFFFKQGPSEIYENGVLKNSVNIGSDGLSGFQIGRKTKSSTQYMKGNIVEVLVYDKELTISEHEQVLTYIMNKYAPPVNFGEDLTINYGFCDTTLSSPSYFTSYLWSNGSTDSTTTINNQGEYWLEGTDIFGRVSRDTILITRPIYDEIQIDNNLICFNQPDTITANIPQGNYSFQEWSDGNTNPTRILNQNESISYTVSDSLGCVRTSNTATISIDNSLENITLGIDTSLCSGNSIQLVQDTSVISNYLWNTGNSNPSQIVDTSGIFILGVTNNNACENSDTIEVTVIGTAPSLSYSIENEICQGSPLNFSENSTVPPGNTIDQVIWNLGEVDSVFSSSGAQIYQDSGLYAGFVEVTTLEGCSSKENFVIEVFPKPIISFETTNYCPYEDIIFEASNEYVVPLNSFNWNFDQDGNTSNEVSPLYNFGVTGNYNVELISIDSNQCADTVVQVVFIQPAPVADIFISNPCELNALEISDNSSITDTFSIVTYAWNYGDNTSAINPIEEKSYEEYGAYTVQLVLTANNGCVDSTEQNITVHPNPILNYEVGPACMNTWTNLSDLSEIPLGSLSESNWLINLQFSDNQTNTAFKFPTKGIQLISLQSTSDQGCVRDTSFTVDVAEELSAEFTVTPNTLITETPMLFSNQSLNIDSAYWDFGNGNGLEYNINNLNEVTYESGLNGSSIDVVLIVNNQLGCRDTSVQTFTVKEAFYDLAIETIFVQDINGYLTVGAEIQNLGSIPLENADLFLKTPENGSIQESWTGSIAQYASEIYIFNAHPSSYISSQDETDRYVCVEGIGVNSLGSPDVNPNNNTTCKNIESTGLIVLPIYPNPTEDDITLSILLTESSILNIELIDQSGRLIYNQNNPESIEPGIHKVQLPFSQLNKGIYYVRVSDDITTLLKKIVRY